VGPRERLYKLRPTIKLGSLARGPEGAEVVAGGVVEVSQRVPAGKSLFWEPEVLFGDDFYLRKEAGGAAVQGLSAAQPLARAVLGHRALARPRPRPGVLKQGARRVPQVPLG